MMSRYILVSKDTGKIFEHTELSEGQYFSSISAVQFFYDNEMKTNGIFNYVVCSASGIVLRHFFDETPMYILRHRDGLVYGQWCPDRGRIISEFIEDNGRYDAGNEHQRDISRWRTVDQKLRTVYPGRTYFVPAPERDGLLAVGLKTKYGLSVFMPSSGNPWYASVHQLRRFAIDQWRLIQFKTTPNCVERKNQPNMVVLRSLADGKWEVLPEIDLFL